jgi:hypothetical protein
LLLSKGAKKKYHRKSSVAGFQGKVRDGEFNILGPKIPTAPDNLEGVDLEGNIEEITVSARVRPGKRIVRTTFASPKFPFEEDFLVILVDEEDK